MASLNGHPRTHFSISRITRQSHELQRMSAVWLLPVVTLVIAASCGGVFVEPLQASSPSHALLTLVVSCCSLSMGLLLTFMVFSIYFLRLVLYGYPTSSSVVSAFIPMGPMSQGGYSMILVGQGFKALLPLMYGNSEILHDGITGDVIDVVCSCAAFVMWSFATLWLVYALFGVQHEVRKERFPFKVPFWGLIFPNVRHISPLSEFHRFNESFTGRLCQSVSRALSHLRFALLPGVRCHLLRHCPSDVDNRVLAYGVARPERCNFRGAVLGGFRHVTWLAEAFAFARECAF